MKVEKALETSGRIFAGADAVNLAPANRRAQFLREHAGARSADGQMRFGSDDWFRPLRHRPVA